jgi:hypothetical protein
MSRAFFEAATIRPHPVSVSIPHATAGSVLSHVFQKLFVRRYLAEFAPQPGTGEGPMPVGGGSGQSESVGRPFHRQPGEQPQLDDLNGRRIFSRHSDQSFVDLDQIVGRFQDAVGFVQFDSPSSATMFGEGFPAGTLNEHSTHRLGRSGEEVSAAIELLVAYQTQVRLVDESSGVEGMVGGFARHPRSCEFAQFVVHKRKQISGGLSIAAVCGFEEVGHVGHVEILIDVQVNDEPVSRADFPQTRRTLFLFSGCRSDEWHLVQVFVNSGKVG